MKEYFPEQMLRTKLGMKDQDVEEVCLLFEDWDWIGTTGGKNQAFFSQNSNFLSQKTDCKLRILAFSQNLEFILEL